MKPASSWKVDWCRGDYAVVVCSCGEKVDLLYPRYPYETKVKPLTELATTCACCGEQYILMSEIRRLGGETR